MTGEETCRLKPIELGKVTLGGEIGRRIDVTIENNLLELDVDQDFLAPFKEKRLPDLKGREEGLGFYADAYRHYVGIGKLIDAAAKFAAYSNNGAVLALKDRLVRETLDTQDSEGYIGFFTEPDDKMWRAWSGHEMCYLIQGLVTDWRLFGNDAGLAAAERTADFFIKRWATMPEGFKIWVFSTWTGLDCALADLFQATGKGIYLDFLAKSMDVTTVDWMTEYSEYQHVYAWVLHCITQCKLYQTNGDASLLGQSHRVVRRLLQQEELAINGSAGQQESFQGGNQDGCGFAFETCTTAYIVRLLHYLLQFEGKSLYGDMMERAIYNALFSAQSPDGRRIRYFSPLEGRRQYFALDTYCCPNNYRRIVAELPTMVCYTSDDGIAVNLYAESSAECELASGTSVLLNQHTDYPTSGSVSIEVRPSEPVEFTLRLRIPRWCTAPVRVTVNARPWKDEVAAGAFLAIRRLWKPGDTVGMDMPMTWRIIKGRQSQRPLAAVMRGPVVFCLSLERNEDLRHMELLHRLRIDPRTIEGPARDDSLRPNGLACTVGAFNPFIEDHPCPTPPTNTQVVLTEFPDPDARATYFHLVNDRTAVDDELLPATP